MSHGVSVHQPDPCKRRLLPVYQQAEEINVVSVSAHLKAIDPSVSQCCSRPGRALHVLAYKSLHSTQRARVRREGSARLER
jgi:hypothetical protein